MCVRSINLADCRVEYPKLGKYSPQQKLGTNGPPKTPRIAEESSYRFGGFAAMLGRGEE